ncbi:Rossmann-like alpha/beta/alpha sandwich fold [Cynara cardunculus var. scolymus]|uniref:Rossmann-like alpha/beta/alpha sandwich fold n=1 Tax=Cynara cardunculus var. scolymus TaxID=59895 RepID=A0A103XY22_CYNCS|nr:Rossmann-like alpha/beta/alpha sandwich fold [Cynara cardunculus var. scolymus]
MAGERIADHQIMEIQEQNWRRVMSPEIVELEDHEIINHRTRDDVVVVESIGDVFVAVGKNDLDVVKWAVDHLVSAGARLYLVHVFPPVTHIQTPVGKLSRSQLSKDQVQIYVNEENNKRRSLLQNNATTKAILDLIHVVNITKLVMGTKRAPSLRRLRKGSSKSELVKKNAPDFCDVSVIYNGKPVMADQQRHVVSDIPTTSQNGLKTTPFSSERKFFECACFSRNFDS